MKIGWPGILFVVFLVLKLTGVIDWSWWWVTAPLWISFGIWLVAAVLVALFSKPEPPRYNYRRR